MKNKQPKSLFVAAALLSGLMLTAAVYPAPAQAQESDIRNASVPAIREAREMKIALLPVVNLSGEKDSRQRRDQGKRGDEELRKLFTERGFLVLGDDVVQKALADENIDLNDEESHNRATLYRLGKATGADLVAFVVITDVEQQRVKTPLTDSQELVAKVKTKTWLLDVPGERHILSAARQESQARNMWFAEFDSGARLIRNTVAGCVRDTLKGFFRDHPVVARAK
jgi:hypothetical protein